MANVNLVASLIVKNERARFLEPCIEHLLDFCDQVCIVDDASTDGTHGWCHTKDRVHCAHSGTSRFYTHEGKARQWLLDWTLLLKPTHVLSLDADEFVSDGAELRRRIEAEPHVGVWSLSIEEVWVANELGLGIREDGGWRSHPLACCWQVVPGVNYRMLDKKLACRRVPRQVLAQHARVSGVSLLHYGWTRKEERQARYNRYVQHDGGRFHASRHLQSIMWDDKRVQLRPRPWPNGKVFSGLRDRLTEVAA